MGRTYLYIQFHFEFLCEVHRRRRAMHPADNRTTEDLFLVPAICI